MYRRRSIQPKRSAVSSATDVISGILGALIRAPLMIAAGLAMAFVFGLFGAVIIKLLWWMCDMSAFTGKELPWSAAVFFAIMLSRPGVSTKQD